MKMMILMQQIQQQNSMQPPLSCVQGLAGCVQNRSACKTEVLVYTVTLTSWWLLDTFVTITSNYVCLHLA